MIRTSTDDQGNVYIDPIDPSSGVNIPPWLIPDPTDPPPPRADCRDCVHLDGSLEKLESQSANVSFHRFENGAVSVTFKNATKKSYAITLNCCADQYCLTSTKLLNYHAPCYANYRFAQDLTILSGYHGVLDISEECR